MSSPSCTDNASMLAGISTAAAASVRERLLHIGCTTSNTALNRSS